ncbi:hypothetical protein FQZ97_1051210 [compost metagenome]
MEVLGFLRHGMALEEGGSRHHHRAHVRADGQRHHVGLQPFTEAHAGVVSTGHHIHQRIVGGDFQHDIRIGLEEAARQRQQDQLRSGAAGVDAQGAGRCVAELVEVLQRVIDVAEGRLDACVQALAGLGEGHAAGGAVEQAHAQSLLQGAQGVTQRRRGEAQLHGGAAEAEVGGDAEEDIEVGSGYGFH